MLREAIEKIAEMAGVKTIEADGKVYSDSVVFEVRPELDLPKTKELTSLDALAKMVKTEAAEVLGIKPLFITVSKYDEVNCFTAIDQSRRNERVLLYTVHATDVPGWGDSKLGFEQAQIALQTRFQQTPDRDYTLRLCSQITCGGKVTYNDNGVATSIVTQKGVALQGAETIKPLVKLKPFRTFQEVDQPESLFLIRVDERGISFIEADGGMWKLTARQTIKAFLEDALKDMVEDGRVVIVL